MLMLAVFLALAAPDQLPLARCLELSLAADPGLKAETERIASRRKWMSAAWEPFIPDLNFSVDALQREDPLAGPFYSYFIPDNRIRSQVVRGVVGVRGTLPFGTSYELNLDQSVGFYSSFVETLNPRIEPVLRLRLTQPLWQSASMRVNLTEVEAAEARISAAEADAIARRDLVLLNAAEAWLDVVFAEGVRRLRDESIELARRFEDLTRRRIEGGEQSSLDLELALQTVAQRQVDRARADALLTAAFTVLGERIYRAPDRLDMPESSSFDVQTLERWPATPKWGDKVVERVRARSPTLARLRALQDAAVADSVRAENNARPDIRVGLEGQVIGLSGGSTCKEGYLGDGITPCAVDPEYVGGYDRALSSLAQGRFYRVGVVLSGSIPTWRTPLDDGAKAAQRTVAALDQDIRWEDHRITSEAGRRIRAVELAGVVVETTKRAVSLAERALQAEETKLNAGRSTGFDLTRAQELLIFARLDALDARVALARAQLRLWSLLGELVPENAHLFPG